MVANIFFASSDAALEALVWSAAIVGPTAIAASGTDDAWAVLEPMVGVLVVLGSTAESMSMVGVGAGLDCCCCSGLDDAAMDAARAAADVLTDELVPLRVIATDGAALMMVTGLVKVGAGAGIDVWDDEEDVWDDEVDVLDDEVDVLDEEVFIEDEDEWGGASTAAAGVTDAPADLAALSMSTMDRPACWVAVGEARKSGRAAVAAAGGTGTETEWVLLAGVDCGPDPAVRERDLEKSSALRTGTSVLGTLTIPGVGRLVCVLGTGVG